MTERQLVAEAKNGSSIAFEALVTAYEKKIYTMALRYTGNKDDAFDASQEVFIRVFRFLSSFNEDSSFSTWIYRVAVNVCKDFVKKGGNANLSLQAQNDDDDSYAFEIPDVRYAPEEAYEQKGIKEAIMQGINELPEHHRAVIILRDINDLSYEQISRALDISEGTVKSRLARARERLRIFLQNNGNFPVKKQSKKITGRCEN